eukprot:gene5292-10585_t
MLIYLFILLIVALPTKSFFIPKFVRLGKLSIVDFVSKGSDNSWFRRKFQSSILYASDTDFEENATEETEVSEPFNYEDDDEESGTSEEETVSDELGEDIIGTTDFSQALDVESVKKDIGEEGNLMTWKQRIASPAFNRTRPTRRNREEDPLRSSSPTQDFTKPLDPFTKHFLAIADIDNDDMLSKRSNAWTHHMQWARRSSLLPHTLAAVDWEYTRLSSDYTRPVGQVLGIRANSSAPIQDLLESEPLKAVGGINSWKLYELQLEIHDNTTWDMGTQQIFIGIDSTKKKAKRDNSLFYKQLDYHMASDRRTTLFANILPVTNDDETDETSPSTKQPVGTLLVFNYRTNADAKRHVDGDPMVAAGIYKQTTMSPVNVQDISGRNHIMARTFGQKTQLDQAKSYRYTRLTWAERHGDLIPEEAAIQWNTDMGRGQAVRLEPVFEEKEQEPDVTTVDDDSEDDDEEDVVESVTLTPNETGLV